jgi:uncharacterized protein YeaO (DUF488 family)
MTLEIQRIYEDDGSKKKHDREGETFRIFVDRLWARGINKEEASIDLWLKDIAPSDKLRNGLDTTPESGTNLRSDISKSWTAKRSRLS